MNTNDIPVVSFTENCSYNENRPRIETLLKTPNSKEIRILMKSGHVMREHKAPFPIVVALLEGAIHFEVSGKVHLLKKGDLIALDANVLHELSCIADCIIRLSISLQDTVGRVESASVDTRIAEKSRG